MEDLVLVKYFSINIFYHHYQSVQFSHNCVWLFVTPWTASHQASLSITNPWSLLRLLSIESVMPSNHLVLCHPLLFPPSIFPGSFLTSQFFTSGGQSFGVLASASVLPVNIQDWFSSRWTGWISLQRSPLQHHGSKALILQCSVFFIVQLSYPCMTGKAIALIRQIFCGQSNVCAF